MKRRTFIAASPPGLSAGLVPSRTVPQPLALNLVTARRRDWNGRDCLAVELTDAEQQLRLETTGGGNRPSFAIVHRDFTDGVLEVAIAGELTGKGAPDDRGFVGLSFHITPTSEPRDRLSAHDQRPAERAAAAEPRIARAIQYVADPGFHFSDSRERFPGRYEKGADIAVGAGTACGWRSPGRASGAVDGKEVLVVEDLRFSGRRGPVGLFVGDGSRGCSGSCASCRRDLGRWSCAK